MDGFSRFATIHCFKGQPTKKTVFSALKQAMKDLGLNCHTLITDGERRFRLSEKLKKIGIRHLVLNNLPSKTSLPELCIKNLKRRTILARRDTKSTNWQRLLKLACKNYNDTSQEVLLGFTPSELKGPENEWKFNFVLLYKDPEAVKAISLKEKWQEVKNRIKNANFTVGDKVFIEFKKKKFERGWDKKRGATRYVVSSLLALDDPIKYRLKVSYICRIFCPIDKAF